MIAPAFRFVLGIALAAPLSALALVGGAGVAPNIADSPWAGVGSLTVGGKKFTATLIAPGYVLTAAHVAMSGDPASMSFQLNAGQVQTFAASEVFVNPGYSGTTSGNVAGDSTVHDDIAIIRLSGGAPSNIPAYNLYQGPLQNTLLSFVSYNGSLVTKRVGENRADVIFANAASVFETYVFDFDGPDLSTNRLGANLPINGSLGANREASLVGGDSGSPAFVNVNGEWQLAGINTFEVKFSTGPSISGQFGTGGGGIILAAYSPWINSVILTAVPEPEHWLMMLAGLGILGSLTRLRK